MSGKINVISIVVGHFKTLSSVKGKVLFVDYLTFIGVPLVFSILALFLGFKLNKDLISLLVNFGAIFTALLLSVLVLVYDQENKLDDKMNFAKANNLPVDLLRSAKKELLRQLYFNISFSIVLSLALVIVCFACSVLYGVIEVAPDSPCNVSWLFLVLSTCAIFFASNIILTITMIVKRLHALLVVE